MADFLDEFIKELLHLDDVRSNRLLDAGDSDGALDGKVFRLYSGGNEGCKMLGVIRRRTGRASNRTVLADSALVRSVADNPNTEKWDWKDLTGKSDPKALDKFISEAYNVLNLKGNNPLFLGVGMLNWNTAVGEEIKTLHSPLLIFPIKLIRGTGTSSVEIEFVDDDAYFNPCLYNKLERSFSEFVSANFPHPNGKDADFDLPLNLEKLSGCEEYFNAVEEHVKKCASRSGDAGIFEFDRNALVVAQYNHSDMCMYYDVRRNREKIYKHPQIRRIFGEDAVLPAIGQSVPEPRFVLPKDSVQEQLIRRILRGESLIIKGPPGTGKTLTIANIIASLLARGKKVLFASKKLSALAEVNAKLPEKLRKFVMLLDYETEQKTAAVNPAKIRSEFKDILRKRTQYVFANNAAGGYDNAVKERSDAVLELNKYFEEMFSDDVGGMPYYDLLDAYMGSDLPVISFTDCALASLVPVGEFDRLCGRAESAGKYISVMTANGNTVKTCPWSGAENAEDIESALSDYSTIRLQTEKLFLFTDRVNKEYPKFIGADFTLGELYALAGENILSVEDMKKLLSAELPFTYADIDKKLYALREAEKCLDSACVFKFTDCYSKDCFEDLFDGRADLSLKYSELKSVKENIGLFLKDGELSAGDISFEKITETADKIVALDRERKKSELKVLSVLDKLDKDGREFALKAYESLKKYDGSGKDRPDSLDFKAKGAYKKLKVFSSRNYMEFSDAVTAVCDFRRCEDFRDESAALSNFVCRILGKELTAEELQCVYLVAAKYKKSGKDLKQYLLHTVSSAETAEECMQYCTASSDFVLEDLCESYTAYKRRKELSAAVTSVCKAAGIAAAEDVGVAAKSIATVLRAGNAVMPHEDKNDTAEYLGRIAEFSGAFAREILYTAKLLAEFGEKHFKNYFTANPWGVRLSAMRNFALQAENREIINAALSYNSIIRDEKNVLPLDKFFEPIEKGEITVPDGRYKDTFRHSYYKHLIDFKLKVLGSRRNGLGKNASLALEKFERAERAMSEFNADITENLCMSRIDPEDPDFAFLDIDRGIPKSLRALFKNHASAILKLKRCFILSPSTASVLFRPEEYAEFDTVIVDEASQMEPVNLLPVLFRSKQCVLVGDEFQMPPLTHFKVKNRRRIDDPDSDLAIDTDISALSLALGNLAFDAGELVCHYRSKTESLIAFSQREFYPYMRTFPASVPFGDGLGFEDVYTPDGVCSGGVNQIEALMTLEKLREHFDKFYDGKTGKLSLSVGIVAFGEAQLGCITGLVERDAELSAKIENAKRVFGGVPEKLIFFRTIESVQGQETDRLILSLTYGKDKDGNVRQMFGELNRDALGKNIFNVAVTRAKCMITVIHSVTAEEISGNPRISFIKDYLKMVKHFAARGKGQFVSSVPEKGANFVGEVSEYIKSLGIDGGRIVTNYGVTDGSVKIPVAILSKDLTHAEAGIWCEYPVMKKYDFFDYNVRYYASLKDRGWNLYRVFIHEWLDNPKFERESLKKAILKYVEI